MKSMLNALTKAASFSMFSDVDSDTLSKVDKVNASMGPAPLSFQANGNSLYDALMESRGGRAFPVGGPVSAYATPRVLVEPDGNEARKDAINGINRMADAIVRGNKGGSAAAVLSSKYLLPAALAAPLAGAVAGGIGDAGIGRGLLRGTGAGVGGLAGGALGAKLGDLLQGTDFVRRMNPNLQATLSLLSVLGGAGTGAYLGHRLARSASKTDKEKRKDNS